MRNFTNFFQKRNRERLYRQWMEHEDISLEDVPPDVLQDIRRKELNSLQEGTELSGEDMYEGNLSHMRTQNLSDRFLIVPTRYVWAALYIIIVLLVALAIVITLLAVT